jgi:hypothetical protein
MGKYALLIGLAATLGLTIMSAQRNRTSQSASEKQAERQEVVLARQIARSMFKEGVSEAKSSFDTIGDKTEHGDHEDGTYQIHFDASSTSDGKVVDVTAEGTYEEYTYQIQASVRRDTIVSSVFNAVTASTPVNFSIQGGGCSGGPCVSGLDAGGRADRHGITVPNSESAESICDEFHNGDYDSGDDTNLEGKAGGCDVQVRTSAHDEWVEGQLDQMTETIKDAIDAENEDVTSCSGCKLGDFDDSESEGILYVTDGEFTINGSGSWDGLVFVGNQGSVRFNGGGSDDNINGGLILQDWADYEQDDEFTLNGGNSVKYNSSQLLKYVDTLPSIEQERTVVTDRNGGLIRDGS